MECISTFRFLKNFKTGLSKPSNWAFFLYIVFSWVNGVILSKAWHVCSLYDPMLGSLLSVLVGYVLIGCILVGADLKGILVHCTILLDYNNYLSK